MTTNHGRKAMTAKQWIKSTKVDIKFKKEFSKGAWNVRKVSRLQQARKILGIK